MDVGIGKSFAKEKQKISIKFMETFGVHEHGWMEEKYSVKKCEKHVSNLGINFSGME